MVPLLLEGRRREQEEGKDVAGEGWEEEEIKGSEAVAGMGENGSVVRLAGRDEEEKGGRKRTTTSSNSRPKSSLLLPGATRRRLSTCC